MDSPEEEQIASWDEVRTRLVPMVRDRYFFSRPGATPRVCLPLGEDLAVGIVVEDPKRMIYFSLEMLEHWEVTAKLVFTVACQNLFRRTAGQLQAVSPGLYRSPWNDNFDASRLSLPHLFEAPVKGKPVSVALSRNLVLVTGSEDPDGQEAVWQAVRAARTREDFLSPMPLILDGSWAPFLPENPEWQAVMKAHRGELYRQQSLDLEEQFKGQIHVALLLPVKDTLHITNWPPKPATLLPLADYVTVGTVGAPSLRAYSWEDFRAHFAPYLGEEVGFPVRVTAQGFPTPSELSAFPGLPLSELLSRGGRG